MLWHGVLAALQPRLSAGLDGELGRSEVDATEQLRARATVHWHAEPVCCMAFSPDDAFLLSGERVQAAQGSVAAGAACSLQLRGLQVTLADAPSAGGHEGVLVVWDLSNGRRTYLPRLGETA